MKISHGQIDSLVKAYSQQAQRARGSAGPQAGDSLALGQDKLTLSERAREISSVREVVARTPDVRTDRVAELSRVIAEGKYEVKATDIAEKMRDRAIADRIGN